jgi:hypothetical protein
MEVKQLLMDIRGFLASSTVQLYNKQTKTISVDLVRKQTVPTERPPLVGEVSANFCR